jgi:Mn-dependent DtxR family transcriptional regulator
VRLPTLLAMSSIVGLSEQKLKLLNHLKDKGPRTFTELLEFLDVSKTRIADHINELEKLELISKKKETGAYELTEAGENWLRKQDHVDRFKLITGLGEEVAQQLKSCKKASEIRRELIRVEPDLSFASLGSLAKWLDETGEWKKLGDENFQELKDQTGRLGEAYTGYKWFLDYAFGRWSTFENKFRGWPTPGSTYSGGEDDPEFNPELKYYRGDPSKAPLLFIRSLFRGDIDVLEHAKKRLHVAVRHAGETNVDSLVKALQALELVAKPEKKSARRRRGILEQIEEIFKNCLEKLDGPVGTGR